MIGPQGLFVARNSSFEERLRSNCPLPTHCLDAPLLRTQMGCWLGSFLSKQVLELWVSGSLRTFRSKRLTVFLMPQIRRSTTFNQSAACITRRANNCSLNPLATPNTWQEKLAMCLARYAGRLNSGVRAAHESFAGLISSSMIGIASCASTPYRDNDLCSEITSFANTTKIGDEHSVSLTAIWGPTTEHPDQMSYKHCEHGNYALAPSSASTL